MPVPGRPQEIVSLSAAVSSLVVRRLAPVGASSRCLSPSAKAPWQSGHPLLRHVIDYSNEQAARKNVKIDFSLTTNATLLTPQIIDFLAANRVGVTVSIDGPKEMNDSFRVFSTGRGSYVR